MTYSELINFLQRIRQNGTDLVDWEGELRDFLIELTFFASQQTRGLQGVQGERGLQGIQGERGLQGIQGIQGEQGIRGIQGDVSQMRELSHAAFKAYRAMYEHVESSMGVTQGMESTRNTYSDTLNLTFP